MLLPTGLDFHAPGFGDDGAVADVGAEFFVLEGGISDGGGGEIDDDVARGDDESKSCRHETRAASACPF